MFISGASGVALPSPFLHLYAEGSWISVADPQVRDVYVGSSLPSNEPIQPQRAAAVRFSHPEPVALRMSLSETGAWTLYSKDNPFTIDSGGKSGAQIYFHRSLGQPIPEGAVDHAEMPEGPNWLNLFPEERILAIVPPKNTHVASVGAGGVQSVSFRNSAPWAVSRGTEHETDLHNQGMMQGYLSWKALRAETDGSDLKEVMVVYFHPDTGKIVDIFDEGRRPSALFPTAFAVLAVEQAFDIGRSSISVAIPKDDKVSQFARMAIERLPQQWWEIVKDIGGR